MSKKEIAETPIMPIGKYKGMDLDNVMKVDQAYCKWFIKNVDGLEKIKDYISNNGVVIKEVKKDESSPVHNLMQMRWSEPPFLLSQSEIEKRIKSADRLKEETIKEITKAEQKDIDDAGLEKHNEYVDALKSSLDIYTENSGRYLLEDDDIRQEWNGFIDIFVSGSSTNRGKPLFIELKPTIGDDYPQVLRQVQGYQNKLQKLQEYSYDMIVVCGVYQSIIPFEKVVREFAKHDIDLIMEDG